MLRSALMQTVRAIGRGMVQTRAYRKGVKSHHPEAHLGEAKIIEYTPYQHIRKPILFTLAVCDVTTSRAL